MLRWIPLVFTVILISGAPTIAAQQAATEAGTLQRRYAEGAVSHYLMTGNNDGWQYTIHATDVVKRDANGRFYEETGWSGLTSNAQQTLTPASLALRQTVSLDDPVSYLKVPNLANVQPLLIGPITDTLTIYSDLLLAMRAKLVHPAQTAYVSHTTPNSWTDGQRILLGQDVVDFSLKVETVDPVQQTETLLIQHVPPPALHIQVPAKWMQEATSTKPNNFVQVSKQDDGFTVEMGKETFDVRLLVDTRHGHILSAAMHNPVELTTRTCTDRELTQRGPEASKTILREITWKLVP
ncbi:hypothetical protein [Edaphobacter modestus]|uniref:Uncharacterized protein n=1 Tax=Edaphobacter modestus TaxID=388466 RepID=A0A4Q7YG61_9BACT|nr:hypothetical protein [Edaphobacter modestus]RZU35461.1 hypothetical protein BDD14_5511 [Edaphobacter modestus]